ncbi:MAG: 30S ribosomal protein S12 methylthiotransferase RimO [Clostridia bacterium]|nr:30S ribosomal protein S12 methylthiotransferase RimO [Clostridia bacterium]MBR6108790.1 30S ribosomal protein S12 methylthiotransferase RimO [Clostridia bacterium]
MNYRVGMVSLGCSKNRVDSEEILGELVSFGATPVSDPALAEVIIVNTCGFIESAKTDSLDAVFEMAKYKDEGDCRLLVVCGCLSERYYDELQAELPEADLLWGVKDHHGLAEAIEQRLTGEISAPVCGAKRVLTTPPYRAYLRIADGCDNRCTYCAIPLIRGGRVSYPMEQLIAEARELAEGGVTELTVIAQDTSAYGVDLYGEPKLAELLKELAKIEKLHWVRLLYTYPNTVDEKLIDTIRDDPKLCNYIDMPIQHINAELLTAMNRHGSAEHIRYITDYVRRSSPDFILRTTAIVGFPGETEEQFSELMEFFDSHPYDRLGAFTYSPEDGTPAAKMDGQIPEKTKQRRLDRLMRAQMGASLAANKRRIGTVCEVLVDGIEGGTAYCRSYAEAAEVDGFIKVRLPEGCAPACGDYIFVRITGAGVYDLEAEIAEA